MTITIFHIITSLENGGAQEVLKTVTSYSPSQYRHRFFYMKGSNAYEAVDGSLAFAQALYVSGFLSLIRSAFTLSRHLKRTSSSVCVQGWLYQGNLLTLFVKLFAPRTPILFSIHNGSDHKQFTSLSGFFASRICGKFSRMAKLTIFVSRKCLACHVPYKNSFVIPNPVKTLKIDYGQIGVSADSFLSPITLACVARFDPVKNIDFMLDLIKQLKTAGLQVQLLMAGEGMSANNIKLLSMLRSKGLENQVKLLGVVSDIAFVYEQADYTILTSTCESFSNVLLESVACGTPFISSDVGIAEDLLSPESLVIKGYDITHWVDQVKRALQIRKSPLVSKSVRQHFEAVSETYAPTRIAKLYADCWEKALAQ